MPRWENASKFFAIMSENNGTAVQWMGKLLKIINTSQGYIQKYGDLKKGNYTIAMLTYISIKIMCYLSNIHSLSDI